MNRSSKPLKINPVFSYNNEGKVERVTLPPMEIRAKESAIVNLLDYQESGLIPSTVQMGDVDLQYEGEAGALIAELNSIDQNGTFVSPVPLICKGGRDITMSYWRTDGDWHSSVTLANIASEANDNEDTVFNHCHSRIRLRKS